MNGGKRAVKEGTNDKEANVNRIRSNMCYKSTAKSTVRTNINTAKRMMPY